MDASSPNWRQAGWLDGRYGESLPGDQESQFAFPSKEAAREYGDGYRSGHADRKAAIGRHSAWLIMQKQRSR